MSDSAPHKVKPRAAVEYLRALGADALPDVEHLVQQHVAIALTHHRGEPATQQASPDRRPRRARHTRLIAVMTALVVLATVSLASANELPAPLQDAIADAAHVVGIAVPHAHRHAHGAGARGDDEGTAPGASGPVRSDATIGKGAATSAAAREQHIAHAEEVAAARQARADRKAAHKAAKASPRRNTEQRAAHPPHRSPQRPAGGHGTHGGTSVSSLSASAHHAAGGSAGGTNGGGGNAAIKPERHGKP